MSQHFTAMRSKLMSALAKIGKNNGHACPVSQSNVDPVMHEYLVTSDAQSFFTKRRSEAKNVLMSVIDTDMLDREIDNVIATNIGTNGVELLRGEHYRCEADIKRPPVPNTVNKTKLRNILARMDWTSNDIDELVEACTDERKPTVTIKIVAV